MSELTKSGMTKVKQAQENFLQIQALVVVTEKSFIALGKLLWECKENGYWSDIGRESFQELTEEVGISYSLATRLIGIYEQFILLLGKTEQELLDIGVSKAIVLLPALRSGAANKEFIEQAKELTVRDLKLELGQKVTETDAQHFIVCKRCGEKLYGARWIRKEKDGKSQTTNG